MLKIIANNQELDLGKLKGLTIKYNPGIFDNDSTDGSFFVPFSLDGSTINNRIFGFPYKMNNPNTQIREVSGELWHSGIKLGEGTIKASKFPYKKLSCNFYIDNGNLYKDFNAKLLNENDFGGFKDWVMKSEYDYQSDDFVLYPVQNDNYYKGTIAEGAIGDYDNFQNHYSGGSFSMQQYYPSIITPFPILWKVLDKLFVNKGFRYIDSFFTQGDYQRLNIFNTVNAIEPEIYDSEGKDKTRNILTRYNIANHLPKIPTGEFIKALQNFFNIKFYIRNYNIEVLDRLQLLQSNQFDDLNDRVEGRYQRELTGFDFSGIAYNIQRDENDENVSQMGTIPDEFIYDTTGDPWSEEAFPYKIFLVRYQENEGVYEQYKNQRDDNPQSNDEYWYWAPLHYSGSAPYTKSTNNQQGLYLGDRGYELNANLSCVPLHLFDQPGVVYDYYKPKVLQIGNSYQHYSYNNFSLRLLFYLGVKDNVDGESMPNASPTLNDKAINVYWSYFARWKKFIEWYKEAQKEIYDQNLELSASEIKNFDFSRKKLINGNLFFITNMTVQLTLTEIKPAKCRMIKAE